MGWSSQGKIWALAAAARAASRRIEKVLIVMELVADWKARISNYSKFCMRYLWDWDYP